jgi:electron transport complex protein RnfA
MSHVSGVDNPADAWDLGRSLTLAFFGGIGFTIAIVIMAGIREELEFCDIPEALKGAAITLIVAGILSMAFMGFNGVDTGLKNALKKDSANQVSFNYTPETGVVQPGGHYITSKTLIEIGTEELS